MQDRPTASELLATVAEYLENELLPALDGPLAYRTRVAANLVRILEREQSRGNSSLLRERELLCRLLDVGVDELIPGSLVEQVADLNQQLVTDIEDDRIAHADAWVPLMEIARAKLAIIRPGYDAWEEPA